MCGRAASHHDSALEVANSELAVFCCPCPNSFAAPLFHKYYMKRPSQLKFRASNYCPLLVMDHVGSASDYPTAPPTLIVRPQHLEHCKPPDCCTQKRDPHRSQLLSCAAPFYSHTSSSSNNLRQRLDIQAGYGHAANHPAHRNRSQLQDFYARWCPMQ